MLNKSKQKLYRFLTRFEHGLDLIEVTLGIIVVVGLLICFMPLLHRIPLMANHETGIHNFRLFLEELFDLVLGIEFVKMLIKHTPGSVLEVVLFSIARHMVINETTPLQDMITILSIGIIFAIRKYLYVHSFESKNDETAIQWMETAKNKIVSKKADLKSAGKPEGKKKEEKK